MNKNIFKLICCSLALSLILPDMVDMSNADGMRDKKQYDNKKKKNGKKKIKRIGKKQNSENTDDSENNDNDPGPNHNNNSDDDDINPNDIDNDNNNNNSANQSSGFGEEFDNVRREFDKAVDAYIKVVKTKMGDEEVNKEELLFPNRLVALMNKKKEKILKIKNVKAGGAEIEFSSPESNCDFTQENIQTYKDDHFRALINHKIFSKNEGEKKLQKQIENLQSKAEGNEDINTVVKVADAFKPLLKIYRNVVTKEIEIPGKKPDLDGLKSCINDWKEETGNKGDGEILTPGEQFKAFRIIRFFLVLVATPCPGCKYSMIIFLNNLKQVVDNLTPDIRFTKRMLSPFVTAAEKLSDAKVIPSEFKGDLGGKYVAMHNIPVNGLNTAVQGLAAYMEAKRREIELLRLREERQRQGQNGEASHDESDDNQNLSDVMDHQLLMSFVDQNLGLMDMNQGQAELEAGNNSDDENTPDNPANANLNNNNSDNDDSANNNDRIVEDSENIQSNYEITQLELSLLIALLKMGYKDYRRRFDGLNGCYNKTVGARTIPAINLGQVTKRIRDIFKNLSDPAINDGICIALQYAIENLPQQENRFFILNNQISEGIAQERKAILMGHLQRFKEAVFGERAPEEKRKRYVDTIEKHEVQKQELPEFMHRDIGKKFDQNAEKGNKKGIIYDVENVKNAVQIVMERLGANAGEIKALLMNIKSGEFEQQAEWLENYLKEWINGRKNPNSLENALSGMPLGASYVPGDPARTIVNIIREGLENPEVFERLQNVPNEDNSYGNDKSGDDIFNTEKTFIIADLLQGIEEVLRNNKVTDVKIGFIRTALINAFGQEREMKETIKEVIGKVENVLRDKKIDDQIIIEVHGKIIK